MLLRLDFGEATLIADVGFGGSGPLLPLRLVSGLEQSQYFWKYRLAEEAGMWVLQAQRPSGWEDFYAFTLEPQHDVDYEVASYYVSTHPDSPFTRTLAAQRPTPEARYLLRNRELDHRARRGDGNPHPRGRRVGGRTEDALRTDPPGRDADPRPSVGVGPIGHFRSASADSNRSDAEFRQ